MVGFPGLQKHHYPWWGVNPKHLFDIFPQFLADRTASLLHSMIGYWRNPVVRLSVCPSATLCILAVRVGVWG